MKTSKRYWIYIEGNVLLLKLCDSIATLIRSRLTSSFSLSKHFPSLVSHSQLISNLEIYATLSLNIYTIYFLINRLYSSFRFAEHWADRSKNHIPSDSILSSYSYRLYYYLYGFWEGIWQNKHSFLLKTLTIQESFYRFFLNLIIYT